MKSRAPHRQTFSIAGIPLCLVVPASHAVEARPVRYAPFAVCGRAPDAVTVNVRFGGSARHDGPIVVKEDGQGVVFFSESFRGRYARRQRRVEVLCAPREGVVDQFLRVLTSVLLFERDGFLLHAAGLASAGRGFVFAGTSSSGKTTLAREAAGAFDVLGDELIAVRRQPGGYRVYATPFAGAWEGPVAALCVPLEKIFLLDRSREAVALETCVAADRPGSRLPLEEAVAALLRHVFFFLTSNETGRVMLGLLLDCGRRVPIEAAHPSVAASLDRARHPSVAASGMGTRPQRKRAWRSAEVSYVAE